MARLGLVWDWLLFNENRNTIMDIEPCLLLMHHSRKNHPPTTYGILDFMLRLIKEFHTPLEEEIRRGIINSFRFILKTGVVRSIVPILVETQKQLLISPCLQTLITTHLAEFLPPELRTTAKVAAAVQPAVPAAGRKDQRKVSESSEQSEASGGSATPTDGVFSDDDDSNDATPRPKSDQPSPIDPKVPPATVIKSDAKDEPSLRPSTPPLHTTQSDLSNRYIQILDEINRARHRHVDDIELEINTIREIDESLANTIEKLQKRREDEDEFLHELDNLMTQIGQFDNGSFDSEIATPVATCLSRLCSTSLDAVKLPPAKASEEDFEEIIGRPLYILFRHLCLGHDSDQCTTLLNNLMSLTVALHQVDERTIHHLLYYIQLQDLQNNDQKWYIYDLFCYTCCERESAESIEIQLSINIQSLQEHDSDLLIYLIPTLFREYQRYTTDNKDIIKIIVSVISPKGLMHLQVCRMCLVPRASFSNFQFLVSIV